MWNKRHRWLRRLAAGLAFAAIAAPTAQARIAEDSGIGVSGDQTYVNGYVGGPLGAYAYQHGQGAIAGGAKLVLKDGMWTHVEALRPDDRATRISPQSESKPLVLRRDPGAGQPVDSAPVAAPSTGDGFDWGDAGIGAGAALGLMLLGLGAGRTTRQVGRGATVRA